MNPKILLTSLTSFAAAAAGNGAKLLQAVADKLDGTQAKPAAQPLRQAAEKTQKAKTTAQKKTTGRGTTKSRTAAGKPKAENTPSERAAKGAGREPAPMGQL